MAASWSEIASYRLSDWIQAQDLGVEGLLESAPGQPLRLRLIRAILQAARTPHVFEEKAKWPLDSDP